MREVAAESFPLGQKIDLNDFGKRWMRARLSGLRKILGSMPEAADELSLLENAGAEQSQDILKSVYYNSRRLGLSALAHHQLLWELSDIPELLQQAKIPCFFGVWSDDTDRKALRRWGCAAHERCGSIACDFYREAIDGLLAGVGDEVRHLRYASAGKVDDACEDVFFKRGTAAPVYLPLPERIAAELEPLRLGLEAEHKGLRIIFRGYAEGTIYCEVIFNRRGCGAAGEEAAVFSKLVNSVRESFPQLRIQDAAARSVFDRATAAKEQQENKEKWNRIVA